LYHYPVYKVLCHNPAYKVFNDTEIPVSTGSCVISAIQSCHLTDKLKYVLEYTEFG